MTPPRLNVGLLGAGFMGKAHSLAYAAMPMFFWPAPALPIRTVICDADGHLAAEGAIRFGFERSTTDWRSVVVDPGVDIVDIATPNHLHAEIAIAAAEAGKHIICEKPLARSAQECWPMLEAVRSAGVVHMVAFNYRRTPAVALARSYIDEGAIGTVLNFRGTYLQDWSADPDLPSSWRFQRNLAGSGALGDIGAHVVDLARYLIGEISEVSSALTTWIPERPVASGGPDRLGSAARGTGERRPVDVDDEVTSLLRFESGAVGSIEATRNAHGRNNFITFEIHGSDGSIAFNYERRDELQVCFAADPADRRGFRTIYTGPAHPNGEALWPIPALGIGYGETKIIECHDLMAAVVGQAPVHPDFSDGYRVAAICDAMAESAATGRWVSTSSAAQAVPT